MTIKLKLTILAFASLQFASASPIVYAVTDSNQFGTVDIASGAFHLIGATPFLPYGLVPGGNGLLTLSSTSLLATINPATGVTTIIGDTGLGLFANNLAEIGGTVYVIDTNNKLYTVNTGTAALTLIGSTGIPSADPSYYSDSFAAVGGSLYYTFDTVGVSPALYRIDPKTGATTKIGPTPLVAIDASALVNGTLYVYQSVGNATTTSGEYTLDLSTGQTTFVTNINSSATAVYGAFVTPEPASFALAGLGLAMLALTALRRRAPAR